MSVTFILPGSLKKWFHGTDEAVCKGETLLHCIEDLETRFPGIREKLVDSENQVPQVLLFVNGENAMKLSGLMTPVSDGDEVGVIPLAAGG